MNQLSITTELKSKQKKSFQEVLWVNFLFAIVGLLINTYIDRDEFVIVHAITSITILSFIFLQKQLPIKLLIHSYLGFIGFIFLSYLWIGGNDYKDSLWLLFFPMLVAFLLNKEKQVIVWLLIINIVFVACIILPSLSVNVTNFQLSSLFSLLFALSFMSVLTWHNVRYKSSYWRLKTEFENQLEIQVDKSIETITQLNNELEQTQRDIIVRLGEVCEMRSKETGQHVLRVSEYSALLAEFAQLPAIEIEQIKDASPLHDAGKVGIPDNILNKPGRLTAEEYEIMKSHTLIGHRILNASERPLMKVAADIALTHHEHWDGNGYPYGIQGNNISIRGRVVSIADVFDALSFERVYKPAWPDDKIYDFFKEQKGKQFDPKLCDLFLNHFSEFVDLRNKFI